MGFFDSVKKFAGGGYDWQKKTITHVISPWATSPLKFTTAVAGGVAGSLALGAAGLAAVGRVGATIFKAAPKTSIAGVGLAPIAYQTFKKSEKLEIKPAIGAAVKGTERVYGGTFAGNIAKAIDDPKTGISNLIKEHPIITGGVAGTAALVGLSKAPAGLAFVAGQITADRKQEFDDSGLPRDSRRESPSKAVAQSDPITTPKAAAGSPVVKTPTSTPVSIPKDTKVGSKTYRRRRRRSTCKTKPVSGRMCLKW
jgi:hypothetical protein